MAATFDAQPAGTTAQVVSADGEVVASYAGAEEFSSIVCSAADVAAGAACTVVVDGTELAIATAGEFMGGGIGGGRPRGGFGG